MKEQIVFIEYFPMIHTLKMAKGLRDTGRYETILIAFNKFDKEFFKMGYDKIINLDVSQRPNPKNLLYFLKTSFSKERARFFAEIKALNPYIVQITGLGVFSFLSNFLINKNIPRVYYAYDIISFRNLERNEDNYRGIKKYNLSYFPKILRRLEKHYFRNSSGIIHKGSKEELNYLNYSVSTPDLFLTPGCLEDWTYATKKNKRDGIHIVFAGHPNEDIYYAHPFREIIKEITAQGIHFHTYGKIPLHNDYFLNEEKNNPYFHYHDRLNPKELNEVISNYHYGIIPDFFNELIDPLWPKTSVGHKMFNYLEAGLPIIMTNELQAMAAIVKKYKIGICIDYEDIKKLRKTLQHINYKKLQENVEKAQRELSISNLTKKLECFYKEIVERNEKKTNKNFTGLKERRKQISFFLRGSKIVLRK